MHRLYLDTHGLRSGYAGKVDPIGLLSCQQCFERMVNGLFGTLSLDQPRQCHRCCNWDQFSHSNANKFEKTTGTKYSQTCLSNIPHTFNPHQTGNNSHLICVKQYFLHVEAGSKAALHEYSQGTWTTQDVVKHYLATLGIDTKVQTWVYQAGRSTKNNVLVNKSDYTYLVAWVQFRSVGRDGNASDWSWCHWICP